MAVSGRREKTKMASISGSDDYYSLVCIPCHRDEKTVPAFGYCIDCKEHLCRNCYTHHKTPTPSRYHRLQDKDDMPSTQRLDTSVHVDTTSSITTPCSRHQNEMIKFCCRGHDMLLCSICVTLEHNKTCQVDYIPDISDKMMNSQEYQHTMYRMDKLLKKCSSIETETSRVTSKSNDSLKTALIVLKKYRRDVNERIDELQKNLEDRILAKQHHNDERKKKRETICIAIMNGVQEAYDDTKQLNTSKQADQLFVEVKQVQKQLQIHESTLASMATECDIDYYEFLPNLAIKDVLHKEKMIGDIAAKHQARGGTVTQHHPVPNKDQARGNAASQCRDEIYVKSSKDKERCKITSMTVLRPHSLVLVDTNNNSIKLMDVNSKTISSRLSLGTEVEDTPWDITSTSSTQVAVTVPGRQYIQLISVKRPLLSASDKLSKSYTIQTDGCCYGICCYQDKLVVTYKLLRKIEILDMEGRVMTRVTTDSSTGANVFKAPKYVCANGSSIYVSDEAKKEVIMLNWQGTITGRVADIQYPTILALLTDGRLLVCDCLTNKVHQVSGDCTNTSTVVQDVIRPYAVCVDDDGHILYISRLTNTVNPIDNNILVYDI